VNGRQLWLRLAASWCAAVACLAVLHPPTPASTWSDSGAALVGIAVGTTVACMLGGLRPLVSPAAALTLALTAGAEEVVWRWFALGSLSERVGPFAALAATSLAFGACHPRARAQHVATGLAFGAVYLASGSLAGAWCAHCAYNLIVASASRRPPPEPA
jgi:membrane protease YdiL (CAAX protease family)